MRVLDIRVVKGPFKPNSDLAQPTHPSYLNIDSHAKRNANHLKHMMCSDSNSIRYSINDNKVTGANSPMTTNTNQFGRIMELLYNLR